MWHTSQHRHWLQNAGNQLTPDSRLIAHQNVPPTIHGPPPTDRQSNWTAQLDHGIVPPSVEKLQARQPSQTLLPDGIHVQQLNACLDYNYTVLGHVASTPYDAFQPSEHVTYIIREHTNCYSLVIGRDVSGLPWNHTGSPATPEKDCGQKGNYIQRWTQSVLLYLALPANRAI